MKILTVVVNLNKGGTQRAAQTFAEAYSLLGHDSRIVSLYGLGPRYEEIKDIIPVWDSLTLENTKAIMDWGAEIVHIHSHGPKKEDIEALLQNCKEAKIIETNVFSMPTPWSNMLDVSFQLSTWAQWIYNLHGGHQYDSCIVPYPVKCDSFNEADEQEITSFRKEHSIPKDAFIIGRIGQSRRDKWSPLIVDVFEEISQTIPNVYLLLINPPKSVLEKRRQSPRKNQIVHIPSIFGDKNLSIAYSAMDVMLHIAIKGESFGMVFPECILSGTPVVALSTPWADNSQIEVIGNGKGGYVINGKKNLAKTIIKLYNKELIYEPEVGRQYIQQYDYIKVAKKAVLYALQTKKEKQKQSIRSILKNSLDKPRLFSSIFVGLNNNFFRALTIYSTGYKNLGGIFKSTFNFLYNSLKKTK